MIGIIDAPDWATHWYSPYFYKVEGGSAIYWNGVNFEESTFSAAELISKAGCSEITRHQEEWTGTGLPPVGAVCEFMWNYRRKGSEYVLARVLMHDGELAIVRIISVGHNGALRESRGGDCGGHPMFRPIKPAEQIAAEEREQRALELFRIAWPETHQWGDLSPHWQEAFYRLADSSYRKPEGTNDE